MTAWRFGLALLLLCPAWVLAGPWPTDARLSGNAFLPEGLRTLQNDAAYSPVTLWLDKGTALWTEQERGPSCASCHGEPATLKRAATHFPRLNAQGDTLLSLEDQIVRCRQRAGRNEARLEDNEVLALSALLHQQAVGARFELTPLPHQQAQWQSRLQHGASLFAKRIGRMNLACVHCHEQNIGRQILSDVVSPAHPTGFPIYRMSWQRLGSLERRLRACYSGVQAVIPPVGAPELRDLELFLKVRAADLPLGGPSIRR